jgi:hypothetical protein
VGNIGNSVDCNYNELLKARLENVVSLPGGLDASHTGYTVYCDNSLYVWTGSEWVACSGGTTGGGETGVYRYYGGTADNTWTEIFVDDIENNRISVPSGQAWAVELQASAKMPFGVNSAAWNNRSYLLDNTSGTLYIAPAAPGTTPDNVFGDGGNWGVKIGIDEVTGDVEVLCLGNLNIPTLFQVTLRTSQAVSV